MSEEQIKPGYKRTEVGVIPQDWEVKRLREISPNQSVGLVINPSTYFDAQGSIPMLVGSNVSENKIDWESARRISLNSHRKLPASSIYENDLVTVRVGDPGVTAVVPKEFNSSNCASMMIVRGHSSFDSNWLCHLMNSKYGRNQVESIQYGTAQKQFNIKDAINFQYPTPHLSEQRAIATVLSDVDALLAQLDQLIAKKRDLKQATMQQLLTGKTRLPGFSGAWEVKRLGDIGSCLRGVTYKGDSDLSPHDTSYTKRLLRSNNVQSAIVVLDEVQFVNFRCVSVQQILQKEDILICMANGSKSLVGKAGIFNVADGHEYTYGAFMACFRTEATTFNSSFVFYLFQTGKYKNYINNLLAGSSINNLSPSSIESLEFNIPQISEQTAIATILSDMDAELATLQARRDKTHALKQGMMQELLTGKIRLI
ncbi:restriction endonuclease subunit S [Giesbergeria anulus]|uniref:Type I restriction enzyme, S subunit n=1 Tax=Giesbergeria anulus TaxID=180197 RepID=A0A1H9SM22_9BURK|nr:restriction endonuclease subunit S [Giesbergeria anulus]SER85967.1 type I restriction enzyme, S subunit [Giesbergeria anulus]